MVLTLGSSLLVLVNSQLKDEIERVVNKSMA